MSDSVNLPEGILDSESSVRPATSVAFLEGPAALADGRVFFTDIANNRILCWHEQSQSCSVFRQPSGRANGLLFDAAGHLLACEGNEFGPGTDGGRRVTRTNLQTGEVTVLADQFAGKLLNSPNDVAARTNGQIFFTDPCYGDRSLMELDHDSVYRIDPDGQITRILSQPEIQRPNGIALSPDEQTLYLVDSCPLPGGHRKIWQFALSPEGAVSDQACVWDFAPGRGGDGMAVDQAGRLFIAAGISSPRGPHETTDVAPGIYVIDPETRPAKLLGRLPIPEDVLTNVTFGGRDARTLYIAAGKTLFTCRVKTPGWLVHRNP